MKDKSANHRRTPLVAQRQKTRKTSKNPDKKPLSPLLRLLCVEHVEEHSKPVLYLVFEFLQTDLKKWMDRNGKGPAHPLR